MSAGIPRPPGSALVVDDQPDRLLALQVRDGWALLRKLAARPTHPPVIAMAPR